MSSVTRLMHEIRRLLTERLSMLFIAITATGAVWYAVVKTRDYFQPSTFLTAWFLIFNSSLIFAVLLTVGFYMMTKRLEVTLIIMAALILLSTMLEAMYILNPSYLFYWVQTTAINFSDLISNRIQIDMLLWNRLFCLLISLSIWALGLCSFRRNGRRLFASFWANCRRIWIPLLIISSVCLSWLSFFYEPIFDDSKPIDFSNMKNSDAGAVSYYGGIWNAGNKDLVLLKKVFSLDIHSDTLSGRADYKLNNKSGEAQTLSFQTNTGIKIDSIFINGTKSKAIRGETGIRSTANWSLTLPAANEYDIRINYSGRIRNDNTIMQRALYGISKGFVWLPANGSSPYLNVDLSGDFSLHGSISLDEKLEPVSLYAKASKKETVNGKSLWQYMINRGPQTIDIIAADYMTKSFEAGGLNVELKYFSKHDKSITDMDAINVIRAAIDYFTKLFGPLPNRENLTILELPAYLSGGFAGGSMSAMDETSFNPEDYLPADPTSPHSGAGIDVLVHEIAHQWWGLSTVPIADGSSNWSSEGITCYSSYCFMKQYFGEEYAQEHYIKNWQQAWDSYKNAFYIKHPEYLAKLSAGDVSNIMGSFKSIKQYDLMPLVMIKAENALGSEVFHQKLSQLYMSHLGQPITYGDFLAATGLTEEALKLE